jgi:predicted RNA-binding protein YlxR (DUF448 family)
MYEKPELVVLATKVVDHRDGNGRGAQIVAERKCCTACASKLRMQLREQEAAAVVVTQDEVDSNLTASVAEQLATA